LDREQDRKFAYSRRAFRKLRASQTILNADPELQAALITYAVELVGRIGAATARTAEHWQNDDRVPWVAFFLMGDLFRKPLPISQTDLATMCNQLAGIALLDSRFVEPIVTHLERIAIAEGLQPGLRRAAGRLRRALVGEKLSPAAARLWKKLEAGPNAAECKLAARILKQIKLA
jgi:hypothetical protein